MSTAAASAAKVLDSIKEQDENATIKKTDENPGDWVLQFQAHDPDQTMFTSLPCATKGVQRAGWFPAALYILTQKLMLDDYISEIRFFRFLKNDISHLTEVNVEAHLFFTQRGFQVMSSFNNMILNDLGTVNGNSLQFSFRDEKGELRHNEICNLFYYLELNNVFKPKNKTEKLFELIESKQYLAYKKKLIDVNRWELEKQNTSPTEASPVVHNPVVYSAVGKAQSPLAPTAKTASSSSPTAAKSPAAKK